MSFSISWRKAKRNKAKVLHLTSGEARTIRRAVLSWTIGVVAGQVEFERRKADEGQDASDAHVHSEAVVSNQIEMQIGMQDLQSRVRG